MKVTVRDVAKTAKVSLGTVSRVLRGHASVKPESARKVKEAIEELNYRPLRNRSRRPVELSLKGRNVALIILGMDRSLETLPAVASVIHGAEAAITKAGGTLLFVDVPDLRCLPAALENNQIHGILLKGALQGKLLPAMKPELLERLRSVPAVWMMGRPEGFWGDAIGSNDFLIGQMAAEKMVAQGHIHLACLNPKPDHTLLARREASFVWNAQTLGATVVRFADLSSAQHWELPLRPVNDVAAVDGLLNDLLARSPRPTAVFTPGDSIAAMVYRALASRGLRVGHDLSVVSCNNEVPLNSSLFPSLATIDVHSTFVGQRAVDQLAWRLADRTSEHTVEIAIEPDWVDGESLTRAPANAS